MYTQRSRGTSSMDCSCKRTSEAQAFQRIALARKLRCKAILSTTVHLNGNGKVTYQNANFPVDAEGRTYHLNTKRGEVANRILSVGSSSRARLVSKLLDEPGAVFEKESSRGFLTLTGRYKGVPVSIVSTHMGTPNMDFVVRENRAVVDGQMAFVRLGTCGAVQKPAKLGDLLIASHGSIAVRRNPDAWDAMANEPHYLFSRPVPCDKDLAVLLVNEAAAIIGRDKVQEGLNATADSFYSSQGRLGGDFEDHNEELINELVSRHSDLISLEMETFHLLDMARCARGGSIRAVGMCIALAERYSNRFMDAASLHAAELAGGKAALSALAKIELHEDQSMQPCDATGIQYVWSK